MFGELVDGGLSRVAEMVRNRLRAPGIGKGPTMPISSLVKAASHSFSIQSFVTIVSLLRRITIAASEARNPIFAALV